MEVTLKNIGIIKNSTIDLNGLTVITGKNNSGKTTVGKALYSIIAAVDNLLGNAAEDRATYALGILEDILNILGLTRVINERKTVSTSDVLSKSRAIYFNNVSFNNVEDIIAFIELFREEINKLSIDDLKKILYDSERNVPISYSLNNLWNNFTQNTNVACEMLDKLKATLLQDSELARYANSKIIRHLNGEFCSQIAPVRAKGEIESRIIVKSNSVKYYDITIKDKEIINQDGAFLVSCFDKCWFIDDINAVDQMSMTAQYNERMFNRRIYLTRRHNEINYNEFIHGIKGRSHKSSLLDGLTKSINEYERSVHAEETKSIFNLLSQEMKSEIAYADGEYWCTDDRLNVRNLASGSKLILILKLLLENGCIDSKSLIILDEPENHLHPEWINIVAESVVLIQRELGATVLVTTHSPNFLLALETMTKKHQTDKKLSVYVSEKLSDNYMVNIKNVTDNIEYAFSHLAKPYLEMDAKRFNFDDTRDD